MIAGSSESVVEVEGLSRSYGRKIALEEVSLSVPTRRRLRAGRRKRRGQDDADQAPARALESSIGHSACFRARPGERAGAACFRAWVT